MGLIEVEWGRGWIPSINNLGKIITIMSNVGHEVYREAFVNVMLCIN